jgi:DNA topoisomerase I
MEKIGVKCPKCGGDVILRRTKSRKSFYGCSNYPKCNYASWTKPKIEAKTGEEVVK